MQAQRPETILYLTPYILFFFGIIMSIIGVLIKMAVSNMQDSINKAVKAVETLGTSVSELQLAKELHRMRIENHSSEIAFIKSHLELRPKADRISETDRNKG